MEDLSSSSSSAIEADLGRLEADLRQLKVQYDMFFAGALARQPLKLRAEFERRLKGRASAPPRKYAHRFHLNALVGRYHAFSELWSKLLRAREEGDRPAAGALARIERAQLVGGCRVRDPLAELGHLRDLHHCFLEARRAAGLEEPGPAFDAFVQGVAAQSRALAQTHGCDEIELRIVVENQTVRLRARPGR